MGAEGEKKSSKMVFIGIDLPKDILDAGPGAVPGLTIRPDCTPPDVATIRAPNRGGETRSRRRERV